jgi:hypothetical protein
MSQNERIQKICLKITKFWKETGTNLAINFFIKYDQSQEQL